MKHTTTWKTFERRAAELFGGVRAAWYLRSLTDEELRREGISSDDAYRYTYLENSKNNYLPIVKPMILERTGYTFSPCKVSPKLTKEQQQERKQTESLDTLMAVLNKCNGSPWSLRGVIELCKGKLSKNCTIETIKSAEFMELLERNNSTSGRKGYEYTLTEDGKKYANVPSF